MAACEDRSSPTSDGTPVDVEHRLSVQHTGKVHQVRSTGPLAPQELVTFK